MSILIAAALILVVAVVIAALVFRVTKPADEDALARDEANISRGPSSWSDPRRL